MNISIITTVHPIDDTRIFFKEILSLAKAGHKINYIVKHGEISNKHPNINIIYLKNNNKLSTRFQNVILAFRIARGLKAHVVHFHDPDFLIAAVILKLFYKRKIIYDIHELYFDSLLHKSYLSKNVSRLLSNGYRLVDNLSVRFFDRVILAETGYYKYYRNLTKKITTLQNYLSKQYLSDKVEIHSGPQKELNFVYLGSISKVRGIYEIINLAEVLSQNNNFKIHIIGPWYPPQLEYEIRRIISDIRLVNNFIIHGRLTFPKAQKLLEKCDVGLLFLYPNLNITTTLPTKLFEYMGKGLAVIMSNFSSWKKFNQKYNCGMTIDIFNISKEKSKLNTFLNNDFELKKIKQRNVQTVNKYFLWENEEKKLLEIYNQLDKKN